MTHDQIIAMAVFRYGHTNQVLQSIEEMAELSVELTHHLRGRNGVREVALIQAEKEAFEEEVKKTLYGLVEGDDELEMLLLCFEEGIDKPELISKETGWSVTQANNAKKRLFRKATSIRSILQNRDM